MILGKSLNDVKKLWYVSVREQKEDYAQLEEIKTLIKDGHTDHCAKRMVWGDGECECKKKGIIPGIISRMIDAVKNGMYERGEK